MEDKTKFLHSRIFILERKNNYTLLKMISATGKVYEENKIGRVIKWAVRVILAKAVR